jgi:DNA-binding IclR family transcriptional regulator
MSSTLASGERLLSILFLFTEKKPSWTSEELILETGFSRTSLYRYLKTLKDTGFLASTSQPKFTLGPRVTELDFLMQRADPLILHGRPLLKFLAGRYSSSVFITRFYEDKILCIVNEVSAVTAKSSYERGRPMPMGRGAISRTIMAYLPRGQRIALAKKHIENFRDAGIAKSPEEMETAFRKIRKQGVVIAHGEVTEGVIGIAAPVLIGPYQPIAALCLTMEAKETTAEQIDDIASDVRSMAVALSDGLTSSVT